MQKQPADKHRHAGADRNHEQITVEPCHQDADNQRQQSGGEMVGGGEDGGEGHDGQGYVGNVVKEGTYIPVGNGLSEENKGDHAHQIDGDGHDQ